MRADRVEDLVEEDVVAPLPRLYRAFLDRHLVVGDDQVGVEEHLRADAGTSVSVDAWESYLEPAE